MDYLGSVISTRYAMELDAALDIDTYLGHWTS